MCFRPARLSLMAVFALSAFMNQSARGQAPQLKVPVQWCGVQGSPTMVNPGLVGEPNHFEVLWRRHERVSDNIYIPQANITLRSAVRFQEILGDGIGNEDGVCDPPEAVSGGCTINTFEILGDGQGNEDGACDPGEPCLPTGQFPLIPDPMASPGNPGDIVDPSINPTEFNNVINTCRSVWQAVDPAASSIVAIHANRFVDLAGNATGAGGYAYRTLPGNQASQLAWQSLVVIDNFYTLGGDPVDKILGHEVGHNLSFFHGNGFDDDGDYTAPTNCADPNMTNDNLDECPGDGMDCGVDPLNGPNLMQYNFPGHVLTGLQTNRMRLQSGCLIPSVTTNPHPQPIGNYKEDDLHDVPVAEEFVDISSFGIGVDADDLTTTLFLSTLGLLPSDVSDLDYFLVVDLDNDLTTGGEPADEGVPTTFEGAELIAQVRVDVVNDVVTTTATVMKFQQGGFVEVTDPSIIASVVTGTIHAIPVPGAPPPPVFTIDLSQSIGLSMSNMVRGPMGTKIRMQVVSVNPDTGTMDETLESEIFLVRAVYPDCAVTPRAQLPGLPIVVTVSGFPFNEMLKVFFGSDSDPVATGVTDDEGNAIICVEIPEDAALGERLITIGVEGTALTADCSVTVHDLALPLDIKPGSCPNSFNRGSRGVLPVALVGSTDFDVTLVDLDSLELHRDCVGGAATPSVGPPGPHPVIHDVATPFDGELCDCHDLTGDGIDDLLLKFKTQGVVDMLELDDLPGGQLMELQLTGTLLDGTPFSARDCIRIVPPGDVQPVNAAINSNESDAYIEITPLDLNLDSDGFANFARAYAPGTGVTLTAELISPDGERFLRWIIDGVCQPVGVKTIDVSISDDLILRAVYSSDGDINSDGEVDAADLAQLLGSWGACVGCPADVNNDDIVDAADLAILLGSWEPCD